MSRRNTIFAIYDTHCHSVSASSFPLLTSVCRMCVSECPSGFFRDDRKRCKKCSSLCETCVGSRSDQCTTCRTGFHLNEGSNTCVANCADSFYLDHGMFHSRPKCTSFLTNKYPHDSTTFVQKFVPKFFDFLPWCNKCCLGFCELLLTPILFSALH